MFLDFKDKLGQLEFSEAALQVMDLMRDMKPAMGGLLKNANVKQLSGPLPD